MSSSSTRNPPNVGLMLGVRRRRRANIKPALCVCLVFCGLSEVSALFFERITTDQALFFSGVVDLSCHTHCKPALHHLQQPRALALYKSFPLETL